MKVIKFFLILFVSIFCCAAVNAQGIKIYQKNGEVLNLSYADIDSIVAYGDTINNNTNNNDAKYEAVDLGLSVKWATFNVGAISPEAYGDYFAWGEIEPKDTYTKDNYKYNEKNLGDISGNPEYDAATANWGDSWRMPTYNEMQELCDSCTWEWTTQNGVNGYKVTSNKNGNYIFLPAAGYRNGSSLSLSGKNGYYWSSTPYEKIKNNTYYLLFYSGYNKLMYNYPRYGYCVRPVYSGGSSNNGTQFEISNLYGGWKYEDGDECSVLYLSSNSSKGVFVDDANSEDYYRFDITFRVDSAVSTLTLTDASDYAIEYTISSLSPEKLVLKDSDGKTYTYNRYTGNIYDEYPIIGTINGYEWVDLGLSVKWATCNVGATSPEEYGDYFAWGETEPKSAYTEENCKTYGKSMGDISGNPAYDAATANWGDSWRMPTLNEMQELRDNCTWEWTIENGVKGYKVISNKNGNYIFLPAAGYRDGLSLYNAGIYGHYWSSAPNKSDTYFACDLYFYGGNHGLDWYSRIYGHSVRPVSK